jgi:N utilization substance protein B
METNNLPTLEDYKAVAIKTKARVEKELPILKDVLGAIKSSKENIQLLPQVIHTVAVTSPTKSYVFLEDVHTIYNAFIEHEIFSNYIDRGDYSYAADNELIRRLYKAVLFNSDILDESIEEQSIYWNDDKIIVDQFVIKTLGVFNGESQPEMPLLPEFTSDEDRAFAYQLFRQTIERGEEMLGHLRTNSLKWDFDRISLMDKVIIQTALTEILTFLDIPLNVSINEYVEIAKLYSTPKSGAFVNGQLDAICRKLHKDRVLMKVSAKRKMPQTKE